MSNLITVEYLDGILAKIIENDPNAFDRKEFESNGIELPTNGMSDDLYTAIKDLNAFREFRQNPNRA